MGVVRNVFLIPGSNQLIKVVNLISVMKDNKLLKMEPVRTVHHI